MALVKEICIGPLRFGRKVVDGPIVLEATNPHTKARYQIEISAANGLVLRRQIALDEKGTNENAIGTGQELNEQGGIPVGLFGLRRLFWEDELAHTAQGAH